MVGKRIAKLRKGKRWTQSDLAKAAGLSKGYIAAIEEGSSPGIKALALIAECLEVELETILNDNMDD
jgi:transcriptional regulator with XRE-family HTH domain